MNINSNPGRSELDDFAIRMQSAVDRFIGNADAPQCFVAMSFATDGTVGE